jgi:chromatin remodeling complex protein RSC6
MPSSNANKNKSAKSVAGKSSGSKKGSGKEKKSKSDDDHVPTGEELLAQITERQTKMVEEIKEMGRDLKMLGKVHSKEVKSKRRRLDENGEPRQQKKIPVPEPLVELMGLDDGAELARSEVTKAIYAYANDNNLKDEDNGRIIHPNAAMRKAFGLKKGELDSLTFGDVQKRMSALYPKSDGKKSGKAAPKSKKKVHHDDDEGDDEEDAEAAPKKKANKPASKKGKSAHA